MSYFKLHFTTSNHMPKSVIFNMLTRHTAATDNGKGYEVDFFAFLKMSSYPHSKDVRFTLGGTPFYLNRDLLAKKSSKLRKLFKDNPDEDLSHLLCDIPTTPQIFEVITRFCYGFHVNFTPENVIPVSCLAEYLGMTENQSRNNLLKQALSFFEQEIITSWNESIRSLKAIESMNIHELALQLGLVDGCIDSIITKALDNPLLLGEPLNANVHESDAATHYLALCWKSEDLSLTTLHLQFYEPIIQGMIQCNMGLNYVASNLYQYSKRRVFFEPKEIDEDTSSYEGVTLHSRKVVIEAIEKLLPHDQGILPCAPLSEMLKYATLLEADVNCREGFERRIGKQLDLANVNDLIIVSQGCSKEGKYDTECVRRILMNFYNNFREKDHSKLVIVAELVEGFFAEVVNDIDLKQDSFISFAEMSIVASKGTKRSSDVTYQAIVTYVNKHEDLTKSEREDICELLNCAKMSPENLRPKSTEVKKGDEFLVNLEKLSFKVSDLEKELLVIRKEIERAYSNCKKMKTEKEKTIVWAGNEDEYLENVRLQQLQLDFQKMSRYSFSKDVQVPVPVCGIPFNLDRDLLAARSSKLCKLFKENPDEDLSHLLRDIPTTTQIFEIMARFCYENHSPNNLLSQAISFFEHKVVTGWNESVRCLKAIENQIVLQQASKLGLLDTCIDSIINKALDNPLLLGEPIKNPVLYDDDSSADDEGFNGNFYEPIIRGMIQCKMDSTYIASNLYQYFKSWVFIDLKETDEDTSSSEGVSLNSRKLAIEAIERLLPHDQGVLLCALLSEMLQLATVLEANANCRDGFEVRIGRQLDLATVDDLLTQCYSKDKKYDTTCVERILKHFCNYFTMQDQSRLDVVTELVEDFLEGVERSSDGIYRAIDIYLNKHRNLKDSEREEICAVLDCNKMSVEACEHAAQNERLPVCVTVQVLFVGQLRLRESSKSAEDYEVNDEEVKIQLEKITFRVTELEKECLMLKKEIEKGCCSCRKMESEKENTNIIAGNEDETSVHVELQPLQLSNYEGSSKITLHFVYSSQLHLRRKRKRKSKVDEFCRTTLGTLVNLYVIPSRTYLWRTLFISLMADNILITTENCCSIAVLNSNFTAPNSDLTAPNLLKSYYA
ncbi:phototropic-responsive NPH3 family protein [Artemisia annua]|uniref:Phototropic-responsive NPH3 family protein n=1 Tax=Artemisia annua TaxID=35608 RepID=A0A2U1LF15_ARTAN|nr:phototropic-responsive NPH3 family protein [Artemisia annua]